MIRILFVCSLTVIITHATAKAEPFLRVVDGGTNNGNRLIDILINPDPTRFDIDISDPPDGIADASSMAVELAFSVSGTTFVDAVQGINFEDDTIPPVGLPGINPFTGTVTEGIVIEPNLTEMFAALGSTFDLGNPDLGLISNETLLLTLEVTGLDAIVLNYGTAASGQMDGSLVAQGGELFEVSGTVEFAAIPEPTALALAAIGVLVIAGCRFYQPLGGSD